MRRGYADTRHGQVFYLQEGDQGDPVILMHQSPRSSRMYEKVIPLLSPHYRVWALDMLGYGYSDPSPVVDDVVFALAEMVSDVVDWLELGRVHIYGLHTGAAVAAEACAAFPDKFETLTVFCFPILDQEARDVMNEMHRSYGGYKSWDAEADGTHLIRMWIRAMDDPVRWMLHTEHPPPDGWKYDIDNVSSKTYLPSPAKATHIWIQEHYLDYCEGMMIDFLLAGDAQKRGKSVYDSLYNRDPLPALSKIQCPTLLIEPDSPYEAFFTQTADRAVKLIPNAEIHRLAKADDNISWWNPSTLSDAIHGYLQKHPIGAVAPSA